MGIGKLDIKLGALDRRKASMVLLAVLVVAVAVWVVVTAGARLDLLARQVEAKRAELDGFSELGAEYGSVLAAVSEVRRKAIAGASTANPVAAVEEAAGAVGAEDLISSIRPLGEKTTHGYTKKTFEVKLERVNLNQAVNLLYLLETSRSLYVVDEFFMKSRFDKPELLDITLKLVNVTGRPAGS